MLKARRSGLVALLVLATVACSSQDPAGTDGRLLVVATTSIVGDVTTRIAGTEARVEVLMQAGQDPHSFQPSVRQAATLEEADLIVSSGLDLEESLLDLLAAAERSGVRVLRLGDELDPLPFADDAGAADTPGSLDPHFWMDPVRMADGVTLIGAALSSEDPTGSASWEERAASYRDEVLATHAEIERLLASVPADRRKLVTNHDALGYFAARYGFAIIGAIIPGGSTIAEPSAADLAALVTSIDAAGVDAIFVETTARTDLAQALANEAGRPIALVTLYTGSLGEPGTDAGTYLGMIREDARRIAEALG